jgi:hypothetical protein
MQRTAREAVGDSSALIDSCIAGLAARWNLSCSTTREGGMRHEFDIGCLRGGAIAVASRVAAAHVQQLVARVSS